MKESPPIFPRFIVRHGLLSAGRAKTLQKGWARANTCRRCQLLLAAAESDTGGQLNRRNEQIREEAGSLSVPKCRETTQITLFRLPQIPRVSGIVSFGRPPWKRNSKGPRAGAQGKMQDVGPAIQTLGRPECFTSMHLQEIPSPTSLRPERTYLTEGGDVTVVAAHRQHSLSNTLRRRGGKRNQKASASVRRACGGIVYQQAGCMNAKFRNEGYAVVMAPLSRINSTQNRRVQPGEHYQLCPSRWRRSHVLICNRAMDGIDIQSFWGQRPRWVGQGGEEAQWQIRGKLPTKKDADSNKQASKQASDAFIHSPESRHPTPKRN